MQTHIIKLADGTEISSGQGKKNAIIKIKKTCAVNNGEELTLGSVFSNILEATILTPGGQLGVTSGEEVTLYSVDDFGKKTPIGIYVLEKPTRPTANTISLTGYDRTIKLDADLTEWISGLTNWPYTLVDFARMVCAACGVPISINSIPNANFPVYEFSQSGITGRKIMRWIGEICGRFCRANASGQIEFSWYEQTEKRITPSGEYGYFADSLSYDTYVVKPADAVKLRLSDNQHGALWPSGAARNPYIISGNAILLSRVTDALIPYLEVIENAVKLSYTPCNVSIPATSDITPGDIVAIEDKNGVTIKTLVMQKVTSGQRDTITCTGSPFRGSPTASSNKTESEKFALYEAAAANAAKKAVDAQTQEEIFAKLTNNGKIQGIFYQDGKWYINASLAEIYNLNADRISAGKVLAARIDVDGLFAKDISVSGTFTQTAEVFFEPGIEEYLTIYELASSTTSFTDEELRLYDFDGDGAITLSDALRAYGAAVGKDSLANWIGAVKSSANVTIDLKKPNKAIRVSGTNMWGRNVEKYFGINMVFSGNNVENAFDVMLKQNAAFKDLEERVKAVENK